MTQQQRRALPPCTWPNQEDKVMSSHVEYLQSLVKQLQSVGATKDAYTQAAMEAAIAEIAKTAPPETPKVQPGQS